VEYWRFIRQAVGPARVIIPGVDAAIVREDHVLLVRNRANGRWFLPGGLQELGETVVDTAVREVREEIGVKLAPGRLMAVYSGDRWIRRYARGEELQSLTFLVEMHVDDDLAGRVRLDTEELSDWRWFALGALPEDMQDYARDMCDVIRVFDGLTLLR
jgi:ADP-ribose pyrophosphatase YjhB (NUDIX family)